MTTEEKTKLARRSRRKGKRGERSVVALLKKAGWEARRGWQSCPEAMQPDVVSNFPLYPEVKDQVRLNIKKAIRQVLNDNKTNKPPCVIFKASRGTWWAAVSLEQLLSFYKHE